MGGFQFVAVGEAGQPKNANDRKIVRKAAMLAFRRHERLKRTKVFAAECAAEIEAKASASPTSLPDPVEAGTTTGDLIPSGPVVLRTTPQLSSESGSWLKVSETSGNIGIPCIPRGLGYPPDFPCGTPDMAYIFDYCTYMIFLNSMSLDYLAFAEAGQSLTKSSPSCSPLRATIRG